MFQLAIAAFFRLAFVVAAITAARVAIIADLVRGGIDPAVPALGQGAIVIATPGIARLPVQPVIAFLGTLELFPIIDEAVAAGLVRAAVRATAITTDHIAVITNFSVSLVQLTVAAASRGHTDRRILIGRADGIRRTKPLVSTGHGRSIQTARYEHSSKPGA